MSKQLFSEMVLGQIFIIDDGDGEYDSRLYKISNTEAVSMRNNLREAIADRVYRISEKMVNVHTSVTEVERAAITLLYAHKTAWHVGLRAYVEALGTDAAEFRYIDQFVWENPELRQEMMERGFVTPTRAGYDYENSIFSDIFNHGKSGYPSTLDKNDSRHERLMADAVMRLAAAVRDYREAGRPDGDQTHTIMGMGGPLLDVSTSLAAAIGEFHQRITTAVYLHLRGY